MAYDEDAQIPEKGDSAAKNVTINSAKTPGLTLGLHQNQNIVLADGALDVADDGARGVLEELHANLGDTTARASAAEDLGDLGKLGLVDERLIESSSECDEPRKPTRRSKQDTSATYRGNGGSSRSGSGGHC